MEPDELAAARRALRGVLGDDAIDFRPQALTRGAVQFLMFGSSEAVGFEQIEYRLVPLADANGRRYWVGAELQFQPVGETYAFASVGLLVFSGALVHDDKEVLLRAEWDRGDPAAPGSHAQPHWHVYLSRVVERTRQIYYVLNEGDENFIGAVDGVGRPLGPDREQLMRFHLAMGARWHQGDLTAHQSGMTATELEHWIRGCVAYTRTQLVYVADKLAAAEAPQPAELPFGGRRSE